MVAEQIAAEKHNKMLTLFLKGKVNNLRRGYCFNAVLAILLHKCATTKSKVGESVLFKCTLQFPGCSSNPDWDSYFIVFLCAHLLSLIFIFLENHPMFLCL